MRYGLRAGVLSMVAVFLTSACVVPPTVPMPGSAQVLAADARALRYGATAPEVFDNSQLRDKLRGLFGADWTSGPGRAFGAPAFFPATSSIRMVRAADRDYIAITGCVTTACEGYRGLLLIGPDEQLLARLDEGGFSRYYEYGRGAMGGVQARTTLDGAWAVIEGIARG